MALKPDRIYTETVLDYFMDEVAERGGVVSVLTAGSGVSMDSAVQMATYRSNPSGAGAIGVLLQDMKSYDLTKTHKNHAKSEVNKGSKVAIMTKGQVTTNRVYPGVTPVAGTPAFLGLSGYFTNVQAVGAPKVGSWATSKDEAGFAKVNVNLPL